MKFSLIASLAALSIDQTQATISSGDCPKTVNTMPGFAVGPYLGRWYDMSSDFFFAGPCTSATYLLKDNGNVQIKNRGWFWWFFFSYYSVLGEATCSATDNGKCWVNFGTSATTQEGPSNYNVLYTDYDNVSLVYSCSDTIFGKNENGWVLTRDWNISEAKVNEYEAKFKELMPTWGGSLSKHDQGTNRAPDCTYLPEVYA